jgi:transcriptional regulator with XRE-family HTH domain
MTRLDIKILRERLGLSVRQNAQLLGVSPSTAYRWEGDGEKYPGQTPLDVPPVDPMQHDLLVLMQRVPEERVGTLKDKLQAALTEHGTMRGLHELLAEVYAAQPAPVAETPPAEAPPAP